MKGGYSYAFGPTGDRNDDVEEDIAAFDEALFANPALDPDEIENIDQSFIVNNESQMPKHNGDILACLCSAKDGGLLVATEDRNETEACDTNQEIEQLTENTQACIQEYTSIMKAARKRKCPLNVGATEEDGKHVHLADTEGQPELMLEQMEDKIELTNIYHRPGITQT
ncbi:uncharacterized protein HD556DRAFT_1443441 [Suillus plorans]|uniref:Uncharacterized protein n=1 Tax=Suillus plorans TaxID=116603 RepID=A0A9P7DI48_9AGAM|nr:uncharacterized protein HD556DRAFT_1443441 [Suillus plorans]KAG1793652.1 hypothetical protein HD556DRAFT_1443441 [Suillus plorans]